MQPLIEAVKPHHIPQIIRIKAGLKLLNVTQLTHNLKHRSFTTKTNWIEHYLV